MKPKPINAAQRDAIWQVLWEYAPDRSHAIHMADLARRARIEETEPTAHRTRDAIKTLSEEGGYPIGTCDQGAFVMSNDEDFAIAVSGIDGRMFSLRKRRNALSRAYRKWQHHHNRNRNPQGTDERGQTIVAEDLFENEKDQTARRRRWQG